MLPSWLLLATISILLITTFSLRRQSHDGLPACRKTTYSYSTLSLTWIGQYCTESSCSNNWKNSWDGSSFVIHGYWPASTDLAFLSCQNDQGYDKNCYTNYKFNQSSLTDIKADLNRVWPQIGSIKNFWQYQWNKHGTCYLKLQTQSFNTKLKLKPDELFYKFFKGSITKYDSLLLTHINKFKFQTKDDLGKYLDLYDDQFITVCGNDNQLDQIRICYDLNQPGKEKIIACPGSKPKECPEPIILKQK